MIRIAKELRHVDVVLNPKPLETKDDLEAWYRGQDRLRSLRGQDVAAILAVGLDREQEDPPFRAFVMGRSGVGKSTELTRLSLDVHKRYQTLRFSIRDQLDPRFFTSFDVLLLLCVTLAEETERVTGQPPERAVVKELFDWYIEEDDTISTEFRTSIDLAGGTDTQNTWWDKVVGAFVTIKGGLQYAQTRKSEVVAYKLKRVKPLIDVANRLIRNCNALLSEFNGKEWLIFGEDVDKPGLDQDRVKELFIVHGNSIFGSVEANMVFNLPLGLTYGEVADKLPLLPRYTIYDVPVYNPAKEPNEEAINYVEEILNSRVSRDLFEEDQARRLIIASGANLRELFTMVRQAAIEARTRQSKRIEAVDVDRVLQTFRVEFHKRLGTTPFDTTVITPDQQVNRLVELYQMEDTGAAVPDDVLGVLVNSGVVQEFNGRHWYGIQPLIVDVLERMNKVSDPKGGTR